MTLLGVVLIALAMLVGWATEKSGSPVLEMLTIVMLLTGCGMLLKELLT